MTGYLIRFIGGPHDGNDAIVRGRGTPKTLRMGATVYERLDLDDGEWSGAYAVPEGRAGSAPIAPGG